MKIKGIEIKDPGYIGLGDNASKTDRYLHCLYLEHRAISARIFAWKFGIPWQRVPEFCDALADRFTTHFRAEVPDAFESPGDMCDAESIVDSEIDECFASCGSPIEELFLAVLADTGNFRWNRSWGTGLVGHVRPDGSDVEFLVCSQLQIEQYRVDFAILGNGIKLVVELDGHNFHEKTKEQASRDKARDRVIVASGWTPMRFTGSELWRDPHKCVREVFDFVIKNHTSAGTE